MGRVLDVGKRVGTLRRLSPIPHSDRIGRVSRATVGTAPVDRHRGEGNRIAYPEDPPLPNPHPVSTDIQHLGHGTDTDDNPAGGNGLSPWPVATGGKEHLPPVLGDPLIPDPFLGQGGCDRLPEHMFRKRDVRLV